MEKVLWETEYFALSQVSGQVEKFQGIYILAESLPHALQMIRVNEDFDHLVFTGRWFEDPQAIKNNETFYKGLEDVVKLTENMSFEEFVDWLDLGTEEDVYNAYDAFKEAGLADHIKAIEGYLKYKYEEKSEEDNNQEEGQTGSPE